MILKCSLDHHCTPLHGRQRMGIYDITVQILELCSERFARSAGLLNDLANRPIKSTFLTSKSE